MDQKQRLKVIRAKLWEINPEVAPWFDHAARLNCTLEQAENQARLGYTSGLVFDAYCYIWRNLVFRYISALLEYELSIPFNEEG